MSENGLFRKSVNGFNKKDVHSYIDTILFRHSQELIEKEEIIAQLRAKESEIRSELDAMAESTASAENNEAEVNRLNQLLSEKDMVISSQEKTLIGTNEKNEWLLKENQGLVHRLDELDNKLKMAISKASNFEQSASAAESAEKAELDACKDEMARRQCDWEKRESELAATIEQLKNELSEKAESGDISSELADSFRNKEQALIETNCLLREDRTKIREQLHECQQVLAEREQELGAAKERLSSNDKFLSNVGAFVMELHGLGNQVLETSSKRSDDVLNSLEAAISSMAIHIAQAEKTLKNAKEQLSEQSVFSNSRLEEIISVLKKNSASLD